MKHKLLVMGFAAILVALSFSCGSTPSGGNGGANSANNSVTGAKTAAPAASAAPVARKADYSVTAESVYQETKADKKAFDKYVDKAVEISGKFAASSGSGESLSVRFETSGTAIQFICQLAPGTAGVVSKYEKGQDIKMIGIGARGI